MGNEMEFANKLSVFLPGIIIGVILFQTIVVAPTVFKSLGAELASPFLRAIFPRLFFFVALCGFASCVERFFSGHELSFGLISALVTVIFMSICFCLVPMTNKAKDNKNEGLFRGLHSLSVALTLVVLVVNLLAVFI
tara:strand:+ start:58 stop:468 length:411 start_codon:yes stop_codon:yes gene_type:complete